MTQIIWGGQREARNPDHHIFAPLCSHHGQEFHQQQQGHQRRTCPWSTTPGADAHWWLVVEFWGLPPLILFFNMSIGWFGRFALSTECYRTRKPGYKNLNWPRCSVIQFHRLDSSFGCVNEIVSLVLVTVIVVYV